MGYFILYPYPPVKDLRLNKIAFNPEDFQNVLVYPPEKKKFVSTPWKIWVYPLKRIWVYLWKVWVLPPEE